MKTRTPTGSVLSVYLVARQSIPHIQRVFESIPVVDLQAVSHIEQLEGLLRAADEMEAWTAEPRGGDHALPYREAVIAILLDQWADPQQSVARLRAEYPGVPVLAIVPASEEDLGLLALSWGAHDYLIREQITDQLLARALRYARHLCRLQQHLEALDARLYDSHQRLRDLVFDIARHRQQTLEREARWILSSVLAGEQSGVAAGAAGAGER